ncbi:MAG: DUF2586 domain-containing protein [Bacteroidota bacterium]
MSILFNDVVINKQAGGLGRRLPNQDMISGLLFNGADTTKTVEGTTEPLLEDGKLYRIVSLEDAIGLGITPEYDKEHESAYYQVSQYFRLNPSGDLFLYKNSTAKSYAALVADAEEMQRQANGEIRQLAVIFKGNDEAKSKSKAADSSAVVPTFDQTKKAIEAAKTVTEKAFTDNRPFEVILEGKGFDASKEPVKLDEMNAENVSVVVAMDEEVAKMDNYSNTAAVGVLLGAISLAKVSENIAWIEKFNLTGEGFRSVGFVGGSQLVTEGAQKTLDDRKYIFTRSHIGIPGVYFNDSHTCTVATSDFTYIESNRTINKASRLARAALLPKINAPVLVDPDNGTLPPSVTKGYETLCRSALEQMVANGEASEIDVFVDPLQNILSTGILNVKIEVVPTGTARRIEVALGFKNPFGING